MNTMISGLKRPVLLGFWVLLALGAFLRLFWLGHASYMIDEVNVVNFALQAKSWFQPYETELARFQYMHRMPTLVILIRAAIQAFAHPGAFPAEWITRLPFALLGIGTLPLIFGLGRRLGGEKAGLLALFLVTISPFHLYYSREAYDYAMVMFFATGTLWAGLELLRSELASGRLEVRRIVFFVLFAVGLLHAHLSCLVFFTCVGLAIAIILLSSKGLAALWNEKRILPWLAAMVIPLVLFLPFLLKMLGGGWVDQESKTVTRISWAIVPGLLGRMGWGEGLAAMIPFSALVAAGGWSAFREKEGVARRIGVMLVLTAIIYVLLQTWMLRFARFETRYYAPLYPCLAVLVAVGLARVGPDLGRRLRLARPGALVLGTTAVAGAWLAVSAWAVVSLECRGYNYKRLAQWLAENLPENGIYSYWNSYDANGVPGVYPVPGRHVAYPMTWSSDQDYVQYHVRDRLIQFFQRFPTAVYIETTPADLLQPDKVTNTPVPRDQLFMHQLWLGDPWTQRLIRWKTHPFGNAQWFERHMDKWLLSYNRPEDLPALARKQGKVLYHNFGKEWVYRKDAQMNDWLTTETGGTFQLGNLTAAPIKTDIRFTAFAYPAGCSIKVYGSATAGQVLAVEQIPSQPREIRLPARDLAPGREEFLIEVIPPSGSAKTLLLLYNVSVAPAAP